MRRIAACVLVAVWVWTGCRPGPKSERGSAGPPAFVVETWEGATHTGPLAWDERGLTVGGRRVAREAVRTVSRPAAGAPGAAERIPGFEPLDAAALARYRERAEAAARQHPGVESVLCLDYAEETFQSDGQQRARYHSLVLVLKEKGLKAADLEFGFTEGRSRRRVLFGRSLAPEGRMEWLDLATLKVAVPSEDAEFMDKRVRVLSGRIPGVEVGSLVEYAEESVTYNPDVPDFFFPQFFFQGEEPFLDSIFDVRVPAGRKLNWATRNLPPAAREPQRATGDGTDVYHWAVHDSPPLVPEPMMPARSDLVSRVDCSLFFDWKDLSERTGRYQRERIETTPEVAALAQQIVGDAKTDDEKLAALYHWVQQRINYFSVKGSRSSDWTGHRASETLKNGYGDCTDKAIVLASLARALGIQAYPAIVKTNDEGRAVTEIPVDDANHCISLVFPGGQPRFLDSTATSYRYPAFREDSHGVKAIIHMTGQILDVPVPPAEENLRRSLQTLILKADGSASCVERNAYVGPIEAVTRETWLSVPPAEHPHKMQQALQKRCPGALCAGFQLTDLGNLAKPLQMEVQYAIPSLATRTRDLYVVSPPGFARTFREASLPSRQLAIERWTTEGFETLLKITTPPGYQLVGLPEPLTIHGKHLRYEGRVEADPDGNGLTVRESLAYLTRVVPASDYPEYRDQAARIAAWTRLKLVFRKR